MRRCRCGKRGNGRREAARDFFSLDLFYSALLRLVLNGVSFRVRHRNPLQPCGRTRGFQGHAEGLWATGLLGCRRVSLLGLVCVVSQPQAEERLLRGRVEASERGWKWGFGRGRKLATETSKPVGSARVFIYLSSINRIFVLPPQSSTSAHAHSPLGFHTRSSVMPH